MSREMDIALFFEKWGPTEERHWEPFNADLVQAIEAEYRPHRERAEALEAVAKAAREVLGPPTYPAHVDCDCRFCALRAALVSLGSGEPWRPGDDCGCDEDGPAPGEVCPVGHPRAPVEKGEP